MKTKQPRIYFRNVYQLLRDDSLMIGKTFNGTRQAATALARRAEHAGRAKRCIGVDLVWCSPSKPGKPDVTICFIPKR